MAETQQSVSWDWETSLGFCLVWRRVLSSRPHPPASLHLHTIRFSLSSWRGIPLAWATSSICIQLPCKLVEVCKLHGGKSSQRTASLGTAVPHFPKCEDKVLRFPLLLSTLLSFVPGPLGTLLSVLLWKKLKPPVPLTIFQV